MDETESRIARITVYEAMLDRAAALLQTEPGAKELPGLLGALEGYYTSPLWREDLEADEAGLLPAELKRGVLSQDGVYNVLTAYADREKSAAEDAAENPAREDGGGAFFAEKTE